ncbi:MAG: hypothetical protein AAGA56_28690 [Myxococcota bacterium]
MSSSFERWAVPGLLLVENIAYVSGWTEGDATETRLGSPDVRATVPSITAHGVYHRRQVGDALPTIGVWNPTTKELREVQTDPPPAAVSVVRATDRRLWWVSKAVAGQWVLHTAPLGGAEPLPATELGPLRPGLADNYGADDFFAYHDSFAQEIVVVRADGTEISVPIPPEAGTGLRHLSFAGDDGEVSSSIWFDTGPGMFRLQVPPP